MPYVIWRAAGESNRRKKLGGMYGFKTDRKREYPIAKAWG